MTDCDVEEPAGASGCCLALVPNVLTLVNVDTASGNRDSGGHELSIKGLIASEEFKRDVWQMKRGEQVAGVEGVVAPNAVSMMRDGKAVSAGGGGGSGGSLALEAKMDEQTALLREMLAVMKEQTALLKK
jgi:hypothetical protein